MAGLGSEIMDKSRKHALLDFLQRKVFDPVLNAKPDGRPEADIAKLEHVQKATEADAARYRRYVSADEVVTNFKRDLSSAAAKTIHAQLRQLRLPTIADIRDEFEDLADGPGRRT
jgi:hypothetical protein